MCGLARCDDCIEAVEAVDCIGVDADGDGVDRGLNAKVISETPLER